MKKFYFLLAVAVAITSVASAQLSMKSATGKKREQQNTAVSAKAAIQSLHRNANPSPSTSTVYWSDDFSNPANWSTTAVIGTDNWVIGTAGPAGSFAIAPINSATAANGFALFDSDLLCSGDQTANLETVNNIDLSAATSARVVFSQYYRAYFDSTFLFVSNDGGTTWSQITVNPITVNNNYNSNNATTGANPEVVNFDITSIAAGSATVKLRFQFYSPTTLGASAGCGYAWMLDDVSIEDIPADDIGIADAAYPSQYSCVPLLQIQPLALSASVANFGSAPASNVVMTFNVYDGSFNNIYTGISNTVSSLNPGDTSAQLAAGTSFTPSDTGVYYIEYICSMTGADANTSNDTIYDLFVVDDSTYARDYTYIDAGAYNGGLGFNAPNTGYLGQMFDIYQASQFTSVSFFLAGATIGDSMSVDVFDVVGGLPNAIVGTTGNYVISAADTGGAFLTLPLLSPVTVGQGQWFVAVNQKTANNITLGSATDIFNPNTGFFQIGGGTWNAVEVAFNVCFILRPNNPTATQVGIDNVNSNASFMVYPNPSKGQLFINSDVTNAAVSVTNALGQTVYTNTFNSLNNAKIDLGNVSEGIYTIRIQTENGVMTKNVMISNR